MRSDTPGRERGRDRLPTSPRQQDRQAPCQAGCLTGADVRGWIATIVQRDALGLTPEQSYTQAWRKIVDVNPFPAVLGRICPHPCQSSCNRSGKDGAVEVNKLERFIGDWGIRQGLELEKPVSAPQPESIAVIGSGPAGLSFAYQMARFGYRVAVYEGAEAAGGMLRFGVPSYRLPRNILDAEIGRILDLGVELKLNTRVGSDDSLDDIESRHDVVFLGIGAQRGLRLGVPNEDGPGTWVATDYLRRANFGENLQLGRRVAVIGGGNTAIDSARTARRAGSDVTLLYRRSRNEMPARAEEIEEAIEEGVRIEELTGVVEFWRDGNRLRGLVTQRMKLGALDASGRRRPRPVDGATTEVEFDAAIVAVSQAPDWTGLPGGASQALPAAGDVTGPATAGAAIGRARVAAQELHARLRGLEAPPTDDRRPADVRPDYYPAAPPAVAPSVLPAAERLEHPDAEVHPGLSEAQVLHEVKRCLSCGQCFSCEHCYTYCAHGCFTRNDDSRPGSYFSLALDQCQSCGKCVDVCPSGFLSFQPPKD